MNQQIIQKWETLRSGLRIKHQSQELCTEAEIDLVEEELGFRFPLGYKEYCRVFGSGKIGNIFRVYCPCYPKNRVDIRETGDNLIGLKLDMESIDPAKDVEIAALLERLLEHGYAFADTDLADRFIWDLKSYRAADQSYDIYWIPDEEAASVRLVGRNFYEFIEQFCLGTGWHIMFPNDDFTEDSDERSFEAFEFDEQAHQHDSFFITMTTEGTREYEDFKRRWNASLYRHQAGSKTVYKVECGYDAPGKAQAECLERMWRLDEEIEVELVAPSERAYIPRLVSITVVRKELTFEAMVELIRKMYRLGKECDCLPSGLGT